MFGAFYQASIELQISELFVFSSHLHGVFGIMCTSHYWRMIRAGRHQVTEKGGSVLLKEVWFIKQHIYKMVVSIKSEFSLSKLRGTFQINGVLTRSNLTANTSNQKLDDDLEKKQKQDTIDGRNSAPPGMYKTLVNDGMFSISTG